MTCIKRLSRIIPLVAVAACSSLTDVQAPDIVLPSRVANATGAKIMMNGAIGALSPGYSYWGFYFPMTDEAISAFGDQTDQRGYSYILVSGGIDVGGYTSGYFQQARVMALNAIAAMEKFNNESTGPTRGQIGRVWSAA